MPQKRFAYTDESGNTGLNLFDEDQPTFWTGASTASADPARLKSILNTLTDDEVSDFGLLFYTKLCDLNHWNLWGAGYVIAGGMGDDSFHYFRSWIIGKGKQVYDLALTNPDDLGPFIDNPEVDNELLEYVPIYVFKERDKPQDPRDRLTDRGPDRDPSGEPFEEDTVAASFPKLAAQFG